MKEKDILYSASPYWVKRADKFKGFEVYKDGITHATRCASIGYEGQLGLDKAIAECNKRAGV